MLKILINSFKTLHNHHGTIRTAAMTYVSSLSLFPLIILISSIAGSLDYIGLLQDWIIEWNTLYALDIPIDSIFPILNQLKSVNFASLGAIGSGSLFFTFWLLLQNLEANINAPWECKNSRPLRKKFALFAPFMGILFGSTALISLWLEGMRKFSKLKVDFIALELDSPIWAGSSIFLGLALILFIFLFFCYGTLPRTKVVKAYAAWVSLGTSIVLCLTLFGLAALQGWLFGKYSAVYGSFAILPTIAIGMWICWLITLIGNTVNLEFHKKVGWTTEYAYPNKTQFEPKDHKIIPQIH